MIWLIKNWRIAAGAGLALVLLACGAWLNGMRWQHRWDEREVAYQAAAAEAANQSLQKQQLLNRQLRDIEQEYLNEIDHIKNQPVARPRVIRVCDRPASVPAVSTGISAGGADAGTAVRAGAGEVVGTDFPTGPLIEVAARCDAQIIALQRIVRISSDINEGRINIIRGYGE